MASESVHPKYYYCYLPIFGAVNILYKLVLMGARGSIVIKALCYKPEGREFDNQ
jgi:hypothetical protein